MWLALGLDRQRERPGQARPGQDIHIGKEPEPDCLFKEQLKIGVFQGKLSFYNQKSVGMAQSKTKRGNSREVHCSHSDIHLLF